MLTGDKIETAINIGFSCRVLDQSTQILRIEQTRKQEILAFLTETIKSVEDHNARKSGGEKLPELVYAIVVEGESFNKIMQSTRLTDKFVELLLGSKVVIACRLSPKNKAEIIKLIRSRQPDKITLAIGDGANDVSMIREANVGIGLSGNEGNQAVSSSDYALGSFKDLKPLLFYHGRESYRRNAYTIGFMFYKNLLQSTAVVFYGFFSGFSGQLFYETFMTQTFNLIYTSWPIIVYATQDQEYEKEVLLKNPQLYTDGVQNLHYNLRVFCDWVGFAFLQSFVLMALAFILSTNAPATLGHSLGELPDMWLIGALVYMAAVFIVNNKLLLDANSLGFLAVCMNVLSNAAVVLAFFGVNFWRGDELYRDFDEFWVVPALVIVLVLFPLYMWPFGTFYHYWFRSERYEAARKSIEEREQAAKEGASAALEQRELVRAGERPADSIRDVEAVDLEALVDDEAAPLVPASCKPSTFADLKAFSYGGDHTGFAFAGEEGHVPQITGNLRKNVADQDE